MSEYPEYCPVCNSKQTRMLNSRLWELHTCDNCGHVFTRVTELNENDHFEGHQYREWRSENMHLLRQRAEQRIELINQFINPASGRVFEIGCSTGETLNILNRAGWQAYGVDLSEAAISLCKQMYPQLNVAVGTDISEIEKGKIEKFDLVMAFHVIEHIADLTALANKLKAICKKDGMIYLCIPNWDAWCRKIMGDQWPDLMHEHVHYFGQSSISQWLHQADFKIVHIETRSAAWPWLGGIKRKINSKSHRDSREGKSSMPGPGAMRTLKLANFLMQPLFMIEKKLGTGNELCIIAKR